MDSGLSTGFISGLGIRIGAGHGSTKSSANHTDGEVEDDEEKDEQHYRGSEAN
jgi:hypothetical protein